MGTKSSSDLMAEAMERARRDWQKRFKESPPAAPPDESPEPPRGVTIAISREAGAGGANLARALGERLNWPVYDRELLRRIEEKLGLGINVLEDIDEKHHSWLYDVLEGFRAAPTVTSFTYVRRLVELIVSLAARGNCVVVGRGATALLPPATTLRVRLVGDRESRIANIRQQFGYTRDEAAGWVDQVDRERIAFVKDHFHKDPTDPHVFDMVLNTSRFTIEECVEIIIDALHVKERRVRPAAPATVGVG